jgi:tetratricopeptide (TPR) repeat protein
MSFMQNNTIDYDFCFTTISHWIHGRVRVNKTLTSFYCNDAENQKHLSRDIETYIIPLLHDKYDTAQQICELISSDNSINEQTRRNLSALHITDTDSDIADFLCAVLLYAFQQRFEVQTASPNTKPVVVETYIINPGVPKPCEHFCGRDNEITQLHGLLAENNKVFVCGIPGIGKSEFVKAYAEKYVDEYAKILHLSYEDSLKNLIIEVDLSDDNPLDCDNTRFKRHNRFLRKLKTDTLIIIDNFNATSSEELLDVIMKYSCKIIFTTRSKFDNYKTCEHIEIQDLDALISLTGKFYSDAEAEKENITKIIETVHRHTMSVEMSARVLEKGLHEPSEILTKLIESHVVLDTDDRISVHKDNQTRTNTYDWHIRTLFSLYNLSEDEQNIMRNMVFVPVKGIKPRLFARFLKLKTMNDINNLVDLGFIQESEGKIRLQPIFKEITISKLQPSVSNCGVLLDFIEEKCLRHGEDLGYYKTIFRTVQNIIKIITNDKMSRFLSFLGNVFPYMQIKEYPSGMSAVINKMSTLLKNPDVGNNNDRALLEHFKGTYEKLTNNNVEKAIQYNEKALKLCDNPALALNICVNIGSFYREQKQLDRAEPFLEAAMNYVNTMLEQGQATHDTIITIQQYAALLFEMKKRNESLMLLIKLTELIKENTDLCRDYADVSFDIFLIYLRANEIELAKQYFLEAFRVYDTIYKDNPEMLQQKYSYIGEILRVMKLPVPEYVDRGLLPA